MALLPKEKEDTLVEYLSDIVSDMPLDKDGILFFMGSSNKITLTSQNKGTVISITWKKEG